MTADCCGGFGAGATKARDEPGPALAAFANEGFAGAAGLLFVFGVAFADAEADPGLAVGLALFGEEGLDFEADFCTLCAAAFC